MKNIPYKWKTADQSGSSLTALLRILSILEKIDFLFQRTYRRNSRHSRRRNFLIKFLRLWSKISCSGLVLRYIILSFSLP